MLTAVFFCLSFLVVFGDLWVCRSLKEMEQKIFKDLHIKVSCVFVSCGFLRLYVFSDYTFSEWSIFNVLGSSCWVLFLSWTLFYGWAFYFIFNVCVSLKEQFLWPCASPTKHLFQLSVSKAEWFFGCVFF